MDHVAPDSAQGVWTQGGGWGRQGSPEPLGGGRCRAPLPLPGPSGSDLTTGHPEKTEKVARERRGAPLSNPASPRRSGSLPPQPTQLPWGGALGTVVLLPQKERGFWPEPRRSARPLIVLGEIINGKAAGPAKGSGCSQNDGGSYPTGYATGAPEVPAEDSRVVEGRRGGRTR